MKDDVRSASATGGVIGLPWLMKNKPAVETAGDRFAFFTDAKKKVAEATAFRLSH